MPPAACRLWVSRRGCRALSVMAVGLIVDGMTTFELLSTGEPATGTDPLRLAAAAYLARFTGLSRTHAESDLRIYFVCCAERGVDPLAASRAQVELYVRWMQEVRRFKPSTVSRRMTVVLGFYRTCVIDGVLAHSPADYVRRPAVPAESPTLGLTHLQLEALLATARDSANPFDFALVCLLGLLGLRIFEATGANIDDLGEERGHRVLKVRGKGGKDRPVPLPPAVARAVDRATGDRVRGPLLLNRTAPGWTGRPPPAGRHPQARRTCPNQPDEDAENAPTYAETYFCDHDARSWR